MRGLEDAVDEAAAMPTADEGEHRRVGDVIEAISDAALEMREAYWGHPHPGSVGDQRLVIVVDDRDYAVSSVAFDGRRIRIDVEPLPAAPADPD